MGVHYGGDVWSLLVDITMKASARVGLAFAFNHLEIEVDANLIRSRRFREVESERLRPEGAFIGPRSDLPGDARALAVVCTDPRGQSDLLPERPLNRGDGGAVD